MKRALRVDGLGRGSREPVGAADIDDRYLRTLFALLVSATFFEGYDTAVVSLLLTDIQRDFSASETLLGISRALIELGLFFAFFLSRLADRRGRRTVLLWSIVGYTLATTATAFAWDLWSFTIVQSISRFFLGAEYAVAITMIVEEYPPDRRGRAVGRLLMFGALGTLAVALLLAAGLHEGPLGWRALFLVGVLPLLALTWFRRRLRETRRFDEHRRSQVAGAGAGAGTGARGSRALWQPTYRWRLALVGLVHLFRSVPFFGAIAWFFYYAEREQGIEQAPLYLMFLVAFGFGILGYGVCGALMERFGRRRTALVYLSGTFVAGTALFQVSGRWAVAVTLVPAIFFGLGSGPVLGAMATELFPTPLRGQGAAWCRNVFEIAGVVLGPLLIGVLGDHYSGPIGSVGDSASLLFLLLLPSIWLVARHLPETCGRELEAIEEDLTVPHSDRGPR